MQAHVCSCVCIGVHECANVCMIVFKYACAYAQNFEIIFFFLFFTASLSFLDVFSLLTSQVIQSA